MTKLNFFREHFIEKKKKALAKINFFKQDFRKKDKRIKANLKEASRIWREISKVFNWGQFLP